MDLNMLEITSKNYYKCNLETIIDKNGEYFWINLRDFEDETEKSCKATNIEFTMLKKNSAYVFIKKIIIQKRLYKYKIILKNHQLKK